MAPHFDPTDPAVAIDPYPTYEALREAVPVWYSADAGLHFITRHADVHEAWRDRRLGSDPVSIPIGQRVGLMIGSANRDPRRYPDPTAFRIARGETSHLSFGGGIHFCIGAPLARIELGAQFLELARRVPDLVLGEGVVRRPSYQFRGYQHLPVVLPRA